MIFLAAATLLLAAGDSQPKADPPSGDAPSVIHLDAADYRWQGVLVRHTPLEVDSRYRVLQGGATVHIELLAEREFRLYKRGRQHESMALTPDRADGEFRRIIGEPGDYEVVLENTGAKAVTVRWQTDLGPVAGATVLPPGRRLAVIAISFAFFFVTITWSARKLLRAVKL